MAKQTINLGTAPNDGTGDTLKASFQKCNDNFTELYAGVGAPQGRLTLLSTVPVMTATVSARTVLYYSPYIGRLIPIWGGSNFVMTSIGTEISAATTDTTKSPAAIGASKVNDWYVWNDSGTIRLSHAADWTSDISRGVIVSPQRLNGIWVNNGDITNGPAAFCGTYVGTTRSDASSLFNNKLGGRAVGGSEVWLGVWNCYNRVDLVAAVQESTTSWSCSSLQPTWSMQSALHRVSAVCGLEEDGYSVCCQMLGQNSSVGNLWTGLSYDNTTTPSAQWVGGAYPAGSMSTNSHTGWQININSMSISIVDGIYFPLGFHYYQMMHTMSAAGANGMVYGQYFQLTMNWRY